MNKKIVVLLLMINFLIGCEKEETQVIVQPVQVESVLKAPTELVFEYPGVIVSDKDTAVSFRVAGPIVEMDVEVGSYFEKGQTIAKMDKRDFELQLNVMEKRVAATKNVYDASAAVAENGRLQYERVKELYNKKLIAKKDYDQALAMMKTTASGELASLAQYEAALEGVRNSKNRLSDTELKAPFDGYVNNIHLEEGSVVGPGIPVLSMSSNKNSKVKINVSEADLKKFDYLTKVEFLNSGQTYELKVGSISKVKGIGQLAYPVTFDFQNRIDNELLIDSEGTLLMTFDNPKKDKLIIPAGALFGEQGKMMVWTYEDGKVSKTEVSGVTSYSDGDVIVDGLSLEEKIVTKGVNQLSEGQEVKVLEGFSKTNKGNIL